MADYIVKDTELTSVANAIRTAGGTNSLLNFPNGFVSAVNNISGSSSDFSTATLTILHGDTDLFAAAILNQPDYGLVGSYPIASVTDTENVIILYKGKAYIPDLNHYGYEVLTGDIEWDSDLQSYIITGDCSIDYGTNH